MLDYWWTMGHNTINVPNQDSCPTHGGFAEAGQSCCEGQAGLRRAASEKRISHFREHPASVKRLSAQKIDSLSHLINSYESAQRFSISVNYTWGCNQYEAMSWRGNVQRSAASLIKLFVLGTIADLIVAGEHDLGEKITVSQCVGGSGLLKYIRAPITMTLGELINLMLAYSDNSATNQLLAVLTLERVTQFAVSLGALGTHVAAPMMPAGVQAERGSNLTTADDVALFYRAVIYGGPHSIRAGWTELCQTLLWAGRSTLLGRARFLFSARNYDSLRQLAWRNPLAIHRYLRAMLQVTAANRLTDCISSRYFIARKSATGRHVFHDSCVLRDGNTVSILAAMIECSDADFRNPRSKEYAAARRFCAAVGRELS